MHQSNNLKVSLFGCTADELYIFTRITDTLVYLHLLSGDVSFLIYAAIQGHTPALACLAASHVRQE